MANYEDNEVRCSFCGRPQSEVQRLVAGPDVYICNECLLSKWTVSSFCGVFPDITRERILDFP